MGYLRAVVNMEVTDKELEHIYLDGYAAKITLKID